MRRAREIRPRPSRLKVRKDLIRELLLLLRELRVRLARVDEERYGAALCELVDVGEVEEGGVRDDRDGDFVFESEVEDESACSGIVTKGNAGARPDYSVPEQQKSVRYSTPRGPQPPPGRDDVRK